MANEENNDELIWRPFIDFLAPTKSLENRFRYPLAMKTDVKEDGKNYVMEIELPGFKKEDISVSLEDGYLKVEAKTEKESAEKDKKGNYLHRERFVGVNTRRYYIGKVEAKNIDASFNDGILTLTFPKENVKKLTSEFKIAVK